MGNVRRKENYFSFALGCHFCHDRVCGIEHCGTGGRDVLHNDTLEHRQLIDRRNEVQTEMVTATDVGHHRYVAVVKSQTFPKNATARRFQHCGIDVRV